MQFLNFLNFFYCFNRFTGLVDSTIIFFGNFKFAKKDYFGKIILKKNKKIDFEVEENLCLKCMKIF